MNLVDTSVSPVVWITGMASGYAKNYDAATLEQNLIVGIDATNVKLGTAAAVNENGKSYGMICIRTQA